MLKHLLRTASFAKTFVDANDYDSNKYVNIVKHMIVLTKLRNSQNVRILTSRYNESIVCQSNNLQTV